MKATAFAVWFHHPLSGVEFRARLIFPTRKMARAWAEVNLEALTVDVRQERLDVDAESGAVYWRGPSVRGRRLGMDAIDNANPNDPAERVRLRNRASAGHSAACVRIWKRSAGCSCGHFDSPEQAEAARRSLAPDTD